MKNSLILLISLLFSLNVLANTPAFNMGIESYKNNQFEKALEQFTAIEKEGLISSELYYNLGNCYYKINEIGKAILYYEKAKTLNPKDTDILHNLSFCNQLIRDKSAEIIDSPIEQLLFKKISANAYAAMALVFLIICTLLIVSKYFIKLNIKIKGVFISILIVVSVISLSLSYFTNKHLQKQQFAIVLSAKTEIYTEPKTSSKVTFMLHEGSKVEIMKSFENWHQINFGDGRIGWINSEDIEII